MQVIPIEIDAQRAGRASGFLGGLTVERYAFTGADLPAGTRIAILTRAGGLIAAAEIAEGNAAEVDTNTQEVADLLRYQPLGACENVYITLGDADNILAIIPATMRKNWLDDEAAHPPVPANRYPTKTELDQWLARFDERAAATAAAQSAAEAAATSARSSATAAEKSARAAGDSAVDAEDSATAAEGSKRAAETAQSKAEAAKAAAENAQGKAQDAQRAAESAQVAAQGAATSAGESAKVAGDSERAAISAKDAAETAQVQAKASETAAKASEASAKASETAASASETAAKASEQAAGESATAAAASANAAKASETAAAASATSASASATAANASANAASVSATAAAKSAAEAASQVTDTLKRINFAGGRFYSQYYNGNALGITHNGWTGDACIMAWNDRYIIITDNQKQGWMTVNGLDFSFIASSPYHYSQHLYVHSTFYCLGFNGERVAIFYRFDGYNADKGTGNYAEVLDANTGEVLIEKTFTDEEMAFIKAAPCWGMAFTCILKNGDMVHRGTIFSGEDLSIKGYVATEAGFRVLSRTYSTYCCYLTANADNGYSGADPIIVQSDDAYSFWVDDRYTLDESGNPIVTLRNFLVDGIFSETNHISRDAGVLFSKNTTGYAWNIIDTAIVRNPLTNKLAAYAVALDDTRENRIVFTKRADIDYTKAINTFIPVNFYDGNLTYTDVAYYLKRGALIYAVTSSGTVADNPCAVIPVYDNKTRWSNPYYLPSVAYTNAYGKHIRLLPVTRFFYNKATLIYPVENI